MCSLLRPKKDQNSSSASQQALTSANPSSTGSQCARHADALWPNNRLTQVSRRAVVHARCHVTLLHQVPANRRHRYPKHFITRKRGEGGKTPKLREEEKNIPIVCLDDKKKKKNEMFVVLTYSGFCLVSRAKFCWSVMSGPEGRSSILKLWVFFWGSCLRTSDFAEEKDGGCGGLKGPAWLLCEVWRPESVEFCSLSWVSVCSTESVGTHKDFRNLGHILTFP